MLGICGQETEDIMDRSGNFGVGGEQAEVGINSSRARVVISSAEMCVLTSDSIRIAASQQGKFTMRLETDQPVKNLDAGIFQIASPADILRLVEARFQFHHGSNFLMRRCGH